MFSSALIDLPAQNIFAKIQDVFAMCWFFQNFAPQSVNRFALLIHYVVIFQQMFADFKVARFHLLLRMLNRSRYKLVFNWNTFFHSEFLHDSGNAIASKNA